MVNLKFLIIFYFRNNIKKILLNLANKIQKNIQILEIIQIIQVFLV